jgi:adenosylhomocysteine nucleosidase
MALTYKHKMIGIISAMHEEINAILKIIEAPKIKEIAGFKFINGKIASEQVIVCECGIGKVNSAICTTILINEFSITKLIFTGVAGALNKSLDIGDVVISKDLMYHDFDVTALGYKMGQIPRMDSSVFKACEELSEIAYNSAITLSNERSVMYGRILSGDVFVGDDNSSKKIYDELKGDCVEMEGAAVAHACFLFNVPFVLIRIISDKADSEAKVDFPEFVKKSAVLLKDIVVKMLWNGQ